MCRFVIYKGERIPLETLVLQPEHSLVCQSRDATFHPGCGDKRNIRVNGDGFGVAWYVLGKEHKGSCILKSTGPAWNSSHLLNVAEFMESDLIFGHVRAASNTGNTEAGVQIVGRVSQENCHPFKYKKYTFMHNGGVPAFCKIRRQILALVSDEVFHSVEGTTDSEHIFALFLNEIADFSVQLTAAEISQAVVSSFEKLVKLCQDAKEFAPMSLNVAVSDGVHVVVTRFRNSSTQQPPSLYFATGSDFICNEKGEFKARSEGLQSVVLCSEPLTRNPNAWALVPKNHIIIIEGDVKTRSVKSIEMKNMITLMSAEIYSEPRIHSDQIKIPFKECKGECPIVSTFALSKHSSRKSKNNIFNWGGPFQWWKK
mmetsp:Transcript_12905/g.16852  ORF Transcript_12905/g.16852 Transcript_12905/m.16852 type:complete len:370 (+) Transcript_12905:151-1260(+)